jgi:hypothetical protein
VVYVGSFVEFLAEAAQLRVESQGDGEGFGDGFKSDVVVCGADPSGRDDITVRFRERLDFVAYLVDFVTYNGNLSNFVKVSIWVPSKPSLL